MFMCVLPWARMETYALTPSEAHKRTWVHFHSQAGFFFRSDRTQSKTKGGLAHPSPEWRQYLNRR